MLALLPLGRPTPDFEQGEVVFIALTLAFKADQYVGHCHSRGVAA